MLLDKRYDGDYGDRVEHNTLVPAQDTWGEADDVLVNEAPREPCDTYQKN